MLRTRLCELLGIEVPILGAPLGMIAGPELAAAVSNAGGLGIMSFNGNPPPVLREEIRRLRADFLAALGRLGSFEIAMGRLAQCRYEIQLNERADDLSRDYFQLWHLIARRSGATWPEEEREAERLDYFAMQVGRLEGIADALVVAGRNVRLFPLPNVPWLTAS